MKYMNLVFAACVSSFILCFQYVSFSQHLPQGGYHADRERSIDIVHYRTDLSFNFDNQQLFGKATIQLHPLSQTNEFSLDAVRLNIKKAELINSKTVKPLTFKINKQSLSVSLDRIYSSEDTLMVVIDYSCQPNAGMYFQKDQNHKGQFFVHTYGEGGLLANWLPIYNDVNDKFSTEMVVTVPKPYTVISNGVLAEVKEQSNGEQTFNWQQKLPHSNYLISVYVGEFEKGDLRSAFGSIPMSYWVPKGRLKEGAYAFRNTTKMVEFFSTHFNYRFPWDKYDQIAVPDYAIGAMEHTGVTGHQRSVLRDEQAPYDFGPPVFDHYNNFWTSEGTISHELAHHWFGDNLTCRNLSYIWLNESFASYLQMLWDEESVGKQQLQMDRQIALDRYLEFVDKEHIIRPLEYHYFDKPDDIYNEQHTYLKGAIVLHMLRNILGDDAFFSALSYYLHKHEFSNVISTDLKIAFEEAVGKNLDWFFKDWVYGGGHPIFEVSYKYLNNRKLLVLTVKQVQPFVKLQDVFTLPVEITIATSGGVEEQMVWVKNEVDQFLIECDEKPHMVSFDGRGALVGVIHFPKEIEELVYQIEHDELPGKLWAVRQMARQYPTRMKTLSVYKSILSGNAYWGLKAEAAYQLGTIRTRAAEAEIGQALKAKDYRVRKAAVLALGKFGTVSAEKTLLRIIRNDSHTDVAATAIVTLAKAFPETDADFIQKQLSRTSWYDEIKIACMEAFQALGRKDLVKYIQPYCGAKYNQHVRLAAINAWKTCAPEDAALHKILMENVYGAPYDLQKQALDLLGELYVMEARPLLEKVVEESGDANLRDRAEEALAAMQNLNSENRER